MSWGVHHLSQNEVDEEEETKELGKFEADGKNECNSIQDGQKTADIVETTDAPVAMAAKTPNLQTRGEFALFCSVVLNSQHRNVA